MSPGSKKRRGTGVASLSRLTRHKMRSSLVHNSNSASNPHPPPIRYSLLSSPPIKHPTSPKKNVQAPNTKQDFGSRIDTNINASAECSESTYRDLETARRSKIFLLAGRKAVQRDQCLDLNGPRDKRGRDGGGCGMWVPFQLRSERVPNSDILWDK
jgi:hypothetical protein